MSNSLASIQVTTPLTCTRPIKEQRRDSDEDKGEVISDARLKPEVLASKVLPVKVDIAFNTRAALDSRDVRYLSLLLLEAGRRIFPRVRVGNDQIDR